MSRALGILLLVGTLGSMGAIAAPAVKLSYDETVRARYSRQFAQEFHFNGRAGERVRFRVRAELLPVVHELSGDVKAKGSSEELAITYVEEGSGDQFVSTARLAADGPHVLSLRCVGGDFTCEGTFEVRLERIVPAAPRVRKLGKGELVRGTLREGAALSDEPPGIGHVYETFEFDGTQGERVQLFLDASTGAHLVLNRPGGFLVKLEEGAGEEEGLTVATLPTTGTYSLEVHLDEPGIFILRKDGGPATNAGRFLRTRLTPGKPYTARVPVTSASDASSENFVFTGRAGQPMTARIRSEGPPPHLVLFAIHPGKDERGNDSEYLALVDADHDSTAPDAEAQLTTTLPKDGEYLLFAFTDQKREKTNANYTLELSMKRPPPPRTAAVDWTKALPKLEGAGLVGVSVGSASALPSAGFSLEYAIGAKVAPAVRAEAVATAGMTMRSTGRMSVSGLLGPGVLLGGEVVVARLSAGLAWRVPFGESGATGLGARLDIGPSEGKAAFFLHGERFAGQASVGLGFAVGFGSF